MPRQIHHLDGVGGLDSGFRSLGISKFGFRALGDDVPNHQGPGPNASRG